MLEPQMGPPAAPAGPEAAPGGEAPAPGQDPVIQAMKALQMVGLSLKEKGDPKGQAFIEWLKQGAAILGGEGAAPEAPAGPVPMERNQAETQVT